MPHAVVKCFCVCQSFPFPHEDFHHLLCTSWWVASSVSKSTQIENEQHPSQPQTWNGSAVREQTTFLGRAGRTDPCNDTSLPPNSLCLSEWYMSERVNRHLRNWQASLHCNFVDYCEQLVCIKHLVAHTVQYCPGCPYSPALGGCFSLEFITAAQRGPESSSANEERWERWKPWEHRAVGHRLQKLHGNFKGFLFLMLRSLYLSRIQHRAWVQFWKQVCLTP